MNLEQAVSQLKQAGISTARIDSLAIYEHVLKVNKAKIIAGLIEPTDQQLKQIESLVNKRAKRTPLAYVLKQKEFYGRQFFVDKNVLIPRPESEAMIELALSLKLSKQHPVIDLGCGSGILGITYALEVGASKESRFWLTFADLSPQALAIAKQNARTYQVRAQYKLSDLLSQSYVADRSDGLVFANLPYVPDDLITSGEIKHEPKLALFSGPDGLNHYRRFWQQIAQLKQPPTDIILESLQDQSTAIDQLASSAGFYLKKQLGLASHYSPN